MEVYAYLYAIVAAWLVAHCIKYVISLVKKSGTSFSEQLFMSGGMPSAHSAVIVATATVIGLSEGFDSAVFALAAAVTLIVVYDASHVRYMAGRTAEAVNQLIVQRKQATPLIHVSRGHTVAEVLAGCILGAVIGVVVFLATK